MLHNVLFELSNINHVMNSGQESAQYEHLSRDLIFVVSNKMTQIKYFFVEKHKYLLLL